MKELTIEDSLIKEETRHFLKHLQKIQNFSKDVKVGEFVGLIRMTKRYYKIWVPVDGEGFVLCNHLTYMSNLDGNPWRRQELNRVYTTEEAKYDGPLNFMDQLKEL